MANKFSLTSSSYDGRYMKLECTQTQNIADNTSTITWKLSSISGNSNYYSTGPTNVYINGVNVYSKSRVDWTEKVFPAAKGSTSGTTTVSHDANGNATITVKFSTVIYNGAGSVQTYGSDNNWTLDQIPRKAEVTSASDFNDNSNPTISYKNPAGNAVQELQACIAYDNSGTDQAIVSYRDVSKTGTSYTFNLTESEREALRNKAWGATPSGKRPVKFYIRTKIGSTYYHHYKEVNFTLQETEKTKPSVSISCTPYPNLSSPFSGLYIQGKNGVRVSYTASGKYGTSINSYKAGGVGISAIGNPGTSGVFQYNGLLEVTGTVTDNRGFSNSAKQSIDVIPYAAPYIAPYKNNNEVICTRCDSSGEISASGIYLKIKAKRIYSRVTVDNVQNNFCAMQYRVKSASSPESSYSSWTDILSRTSTDTDLIDVTLQDVVPEITNAYTIQLRVIDDFETASIMTFAIPTDKITFHLKNGGNGAAFNKYCEKEGFLEIGFDVDIKGNELKDFVIDEGIYQSGNLVWTWRKYASGVSECWGAYSITLSHYATVGDFYGYNSGDISFPTGLFTSTPLATYSASVGTGFALTGTILSCTKDKMTCYVLSNGSGSKDCRFYIQAKGRWK